MSENAGRRKDLPLQHWDKAQYFAKCFSEPEELLINVIAKIFVPKAADVNTSHLRRAEHLPRERLIRVNDSLTYLHVVSSD